MSDQLSADLASLRIRRDAPPRSALGALFYGGRAARSWAGAAAFAGASPTPRGLFKTRGLAHRDHNRVPGRAGQRRPTATGYVVPRDRRQGRREGLRGASARSRSARARACEAGQETFRLDCRRPGSSAVASAPPAPPRRGPGARGAHRSRAPTSTSRIQLDQQKPRRSRRRDPRAPPPIRPRWSLEARARARTSRRSGRRRRGPAAQAEVGALAVKLEHAPSPRPSTAPRSPSPPSVGDVVGPHVDARRAGRLRARSSSRPTCPRARLDLVKQGGPCEIVLDAYPDRRRRGEVAR